ncbi:hypothetical protein D1007_17975 [Hordeum vulgare]|nr:hypothetical protein D1007_17975 [Hordeum vulgare]
MGCLGEKAHSRTKAQRKAKDNTKLYVVKLVEANPTLLTEKIVFFEEKEAWRKKLQEKRKDCKRDTMVDELFDQFEMKLSDEE